MSGAFRFSWRAAGAMAAMLALASAGARAADAQVKGPVLVLRGTQAPDKPAPAKPAIATPPAVDPGVGPPPLADLSPVPRFQDQPAPRFSLDPAPRILGLDQRGGGAECRVACAETRYQCRVGDDAGACDTAWGQCVANCAEVSSSPL